MFAVPRIARTVRGHRSYFRRMTGDQKELVRGSWSALREREHEFAHRCYVVFCRTHPHLRGLLENFMDEQQKRFGALVTRAVDALDETAALAPELGDLGRRHKTMGVKDHHHQAFGEALLLALAELLGPAFTPPVRDAWKAFYGTLQLGMARG